MEIKPGQSLLHYRIVDSIGRGGMGEVYRAEDSRLKRQVALKVLPPEMAADPERRQRFEREAQAVAALNHPNIVTIYSVEQSEDLHFITMELIEGEPLSRIIGPGGLGLEDVFKIAVPLGDALASAHEQGITHRDLKPDNVMLTRDGRVKVLDFGLAKLAGAPGGDAPNAGMATATVTEAGKIMGTVDYMSPEQAEGKPVDARSDVFSLGILLYEMATGKRPFHGETSISTITAIMRDTPPTVTDLNASLPRHLGRIVNRCLMKDPDRRYQTAKDLRNELEQLKAETAPGHSVTGVGVTPATDAAQKATRRRASPLLVGGIVGAIGLVIVAILAFQFGTGRLPTSGETAQTADASIAALPFTSVGTDEESLAFSGGIHNDLLIRLSKISALKVISRTSVMEYRDTTKNLRQIADELGVATVLEGSVQRSGDRVRLNVQLVNAQNDESMWAETYDRELTAGNIFDIQEDVAGQIAAALSATLTPEEQRQIEARPTESLPAYEAYLRGLDYIGRSELESDALIAMRMMEQAVELDPDFAEAHAELSILHSQMYWRHVDRSAERLEMADQEIGTALRLSPGLPEAHMARGYYHYWGFLDYESALVEFAAAAAARPNDTRILAGIGFVKRRQGRMDEALVMFRKSAELNPRDLVSLEAVALTSLLKRDYDEAQRVYTKLQQLNPGNAAAYEHLALLALLSDGDIDRAREVIAQSDALDLHRPQLTRTAVQVSIVAGDYVDALRRIDAAPGEVLIDSQHVYWPKGLMLGHVHALAGDTRRARESYEAARDLLERRARELPQDERIASALGIVYAGLGLKQDAIREGLRGVELLPYEKEALRGAQRTRDLARIYTLVGEPDLAIDRLEYLLARPGFDSRPHVKLDPTWTPLRNHPRFRQLVGQ